MIAEPLVIPDTHPSLPGHFPGAPVVPGVVLLSFVLDALIAELGPFVTRGVRSAKFLRALAPAEPFTLEAEERPEGVLRFACRGAKGQIAEGTLQIERGSPDSTRAPGPVGNPSQRR